MKLAIMQPYFLPYIGYYQLIHAVDMFLVYDNIQYTKKGWINRNRFLKNGGAAVFTLPLKKDASEGDVVQRELATDFDRKKLLNQLREAYRRAPFFNQVFPIVEVIIGNEEQNLFRYIHASIVTMCKHLEISTTIKISSDVAIDHDLKGQDKVLALCQAVGAEVYVNSSGGAGLYSHGDFRECGIELQFMRAKPFEYPQFGQPFQPWLSIIDVLMFNALEAVKTGLLENYELDCHV